MYLAVSIEGRVLGHGRFHSTAEAAGQRADKGTSTTFDVLEADKQVAAAIELGKVPSFVEDDEGYASIDRRDCRYSVFEFSVSDTVFGVFLGDDDHVDAKAAVIDVMDRVKDGAGRRETRLAVAQYPADFTHDEVFEEIAGGFWKLRLDREDLISVQSVTLRLSDFEDADESDRVVDEANCLAGDEGEDAYA